MDDSSDLGFSHQEVMEANLGPSGLDTTKLDRVKIPSGGGTAWEIPTLDGKGDIAKVLEVVIVAAQDIRAYYASKYSGEKVPPDCFSMDCIVGVGNPGGGCSECAWSQWGTAVDQDDNPTDGQACSQRKLMICLGKDSTLPFVVSIPPGSLSNMTKYLMRLSGASLPFYAVVTNLALEKVDSGGGIPYSTVKPEYVRTLTGDEIAGVKSYRAGLGPLFNAITPEAE
jgi:hypothetical protein